MLYLHLETSRRYLFAIEEIVVKVRESDKDRLVTILVDSLTIIQQSRVRRSSTKMVGLTFKPIILSR